MAVKKLCGACGKDALDRNPNCPACGNRHARWCRAGDPEAPPVPVNTLTTARDVHNHETLTGWLTARRNRLNPTRKKEKEMTTHTTLTGATITDEQLQALALELVNIQADIAHLKEEAARIEEQLKSLPAGKYEAGDATLTVSHPRRFNEKKFVATYSPEAFPQFYQTIRKVDLKTLAPALKDQFADDSTARLTIR